MKYWWLVLERGGVDLCLNDPGFGVDLQLRASVRTMVKLWAVRAGEVEISGPAPFRRQLPSWLGLASAEP